MQLVQRRNQSDSLLSLASGEELLMLMVMSNAAMRRQVRRELDARSGSCSSPLAVGIRRQRFAGRAELLRAA